MLTTSTFFWLTDYNITACSHAMDDVLQARATHYSRDDVNAVRMFTCMGREGQLVDGCAGEHPYRPLPP